MKMDKKAWSIFGFLIIFVVILGGLLLYKYYFSPKKEEPKENNNNQVIDNTLNDSEKSIINNKLTIVSKYLSDLYPIENVLNIDKQRLMNFAVLTYPNVVNRSFQENSTTNELAYAIRYYLKFLGKLEGEKILCLKDNEIFYNYTKEIDSYSINETHKNHNEEYISDVKLYPIDYKLDGNNLEVITKILYKDKTNTAYYKSYNDAINKKDAILNKNDVTNEDYESIKEQLPTTTFKMEKIDKSFVISAISIN